MGTTFGLTRTLLIAAMSKWPSIVAAGLTCVAAVNVETNATAGDGRSRRRRSCFHRGVPEIVACAVPALMHRFAFETPL